MALLPYQVIPDDWGVFYLEQSKMSLPESLGAFYQSQLLGDDKAMAATNFVALDIETTGLDAQKDEIVSIGLVPFDCQRIYLAQAKHWVVSSGHLTSDSVLVHGITHTEVAGAPSLNSILPELLACLRGKQIVVHYRYMEREFLRKAFAALWKKDFLFPVIDTLELEGKYLRDTQSLVARLMKKSLPPLRLLHVRERYNLPAYENHNALVDALATAELLQAQIAKQSIGEKRVRALWC